LQQKQRHFDGLARGDPRIKSTRGRTGARGRGANIMIRIVGALLLCLVAVSTAGAQPQRTGSRPAHDPYLGYNPADHTVVSIDGAYVGRDPDPNIRAQLRRFPGSYVSGGF
jgi:hypothetical protein